MDRIQAAAPAAVRRVGSLRIAASPEEEADCEAQLAAMRADGLPVEPYDGPEGRGLLLPTDGAFQPLERCRILARRARGAGARLYERTPPGEIADGRVRTPPGRVRCRSVIAAVDGGLERLFPELEGRVRTARLQMLATAPAPELRLPRPVYYRWGFEYWQQLPDGRIALGGFRDRAGEREWTLEAPAPTEPVQGMLEAFLRDHLGVRAPITHRWAGAIAFSAGSLPLLEEVRPRVWALGGYSGTGNVMGAVCGRAAAHLAQRGQSEHALAANGRAPRRRA
jgi:glycine/D-amino acid oxidase-like deaminating enzyme